MFKIKQKTQISWRLSVVQFVSNKPKRVKIDPNSRDKEDQSRRCVVLWHYSQAKGRNTTQTNTIYEWHL